MSYIHSITFAFLPQRWKDRIVIDDNGCWLWQGWSSGNGYGKTSVDGKAMMIHRAVYEMVVGQIPEGLVLDHLCRNRPCCNPAHVEPVTVQINTHRGEAVLFGCDMGSPEGDHCVETYVERGTGRVLAIIDRGNRDAL